MTIDALADLLKGRGCEAVCYFHADHFEPWSTSIDDASARAVERMADLARRSSYARRLSLFYSAFVPYRLETDGPARPGDERTPSDGVVFCERTTRQEDLTREVIRPLIAADGHEMHMHVHHEFWTRNSTHFDHPVSRWVNSCSTSGADLDRLDLHFRLAKEVIAREIGVPLERWAFIHGNWALNASDPLICQVSDEMALIMRHGGFGDFSFPAGRSYCDPNLQRPFTCLPLDLPRAYDDQRADPRPIDFGTAVMRPDRFFIWNSPIKSTYSSLDYYSEANRALFRNTERVVATWLSKSVCLGRKLYIKTHAHSMKADYKLTEPGSQIPHCYPDIVTIFDCLVRVCDRAGVELRFHTINEIVELLGVLDGGIETPRPVLATTSMPMPNAEASPLHAPVAAMPEATLPSATANVIALELSTLHRTWMAEGGSKFPTDEFYQAKLAHHMPLEAYEIAIATNITELYPSASTRVIEIGSGWGGLSILLARLGFEVYAFEGNASRHAASRWHFNEQIRRYPALRGRLLLAPEGLFPEAFFRAALAKDKINVGVATNITNTYSSENQQIIIKAAAKFDELIIDLARFGQTRDKQTERDALFRTLTESAFRPIERLYFQEPNEYWRFRSRVIVRAGRHATTAKRFPLEGPLFSVFGEKHLAECPVCRSIDIVPLWRMPMTDLETPLNVFGGYFNQIPTLRVPAKIFCFDFCEECESIFLNPVPNQHKDGYRTTDHYIHKMRSAAEWSDYEEVYGSFARWIPKDATVMVDAACGIGQYLHLARTRAGHRWQRLIGLELAEKYVEHMRVEGFEAYVFDIDTDDIGKIVPPDSVDFISFCEAFEHVDRPLDALRKLLTMLRPGGRLFFTAQRYGSDVQAAVRPGEPIYIGEKMIDEIPRRLGCRIVDMTTSSMRYYVVLEK
jgi:2-polyprenyl-3-methyl-5-hydroxy-6-metoxy-1,4-benzoquinol methylase